MKLAMVGLGKMGSNMARRLARDGHQVVAFDVDAETARKLAEDEPGVTAAATHGDIVAALPAPRIVWIMVPAGVVDETVAALADVLERGDVVIDGGNGYYKDDAPRAERLGAKGITYLDAGVSGGVWGLAEGYALMVGGPAEAYGLIEPVLATLAPEGGALHTGPVGSGHFVKMVHNGIEYGLMQAYAEGFELLRSGPYSEHHDLHAIARLWNRGSVIRSWLLHLLERTFEESPGLDGVVGRVEDSGEGRWTVLQAVESATAAPVITLSLMQRFRSRKDETFADKVLAALRGAFGGHDVPRKS